MKLSGSVLREPKHTLSEGFSGEQTCVVLDMNIAAEVVHLSYQCMFH